MARETGIAARRFALTGLVCLLFLTPARPDYEATQQLGAFEARWRLETASPKSADPKTRTEVRISGAVLHLQVEGPAGFRVESPTPIVTGPDWQVVRTWPAQTTMLPGGRQQWRQRYRLEPAHIGDFVLQLAPLRILDSPQAPAIAWPPLAVKSITSVTKPTLNDLRDELSLVPLPGSRPGNSSWLAWSAASLLVLGYLAVFAVRWLRNKRRQDEPARRAKRAIQELLARTPARREELAPLYESLADLLRQYVQSRYALSAPARTTREFLEDLRGSGTLEAAQQELLERFLQRCDLVKFAQAEPAIADWHEAVNLAVRLVDETTPGKGI